MKEVNKTTLLIVSILLGGLGIDHFMTGKTVSGILKLVTGGGFGIWWIINIVQIITGKFQCGEGYTIVG